VDGGGARRYPGAPASPSPQQPVVCVLGCSVVVVVVVVVVVAMGGKGITMRIESRGRHACPSSPHPSGA
jgi:hypothetical protein